MNSRSEVRKYIQQAEAAANKYGVNLASVKMGQSTKAYATKVADLAKLKKGAITYEDLKSLGKYNAKQVASAETVKDSTLNSRIREYDTYYDQVDERIEQELKYASARTVALKNGWKRFKTVEFPEKISWGTLPRAVKTGTWNSNDDDGDKECFNYKNIDCGFWDDISPDLIYSAGVDDDFGNTVQDWFSLVFPKIYIDWGNDFIAYAREWLSKQQLSGRYLEDRMYK